MHSAGFSLKVNGVSINLVAEFNQALQNDSCRLQQLQCHTSTPDHPFNRFFWGIFISMCIYLLLFYVIFLYVYLHTFLILKGNKKSLLDAMEKGINLREQILKLYNENYHAGLMKLVVIGGGKF